MLSYQYMPYIILIGIIIAVFLIVIIVQLSNVNAKLFRLYNLLYKNNADKPVSFESNEDYLDRLKQDNLNAPQTKE